MPTLMNVYERNRESGYEWATEVAQGRPDESDEFYAGAASYLTWLANRTYRRTTQVVVEAYCVTDKKKVTMASPQIIAMRNGKPATQGFCSICGGKLFRIGVA